MKSNSMLLALIVAVIGLAPLAAQGQEDSSMMPLGIAPEGASWGIMPASFADPSCADVSCTDMSCTGMVDPYAGDPRERRCWNLWGSVETLLWWMKGTEVPPLVGTSPPGTPQNQASVVGTPGYRTLFGDSTLGGDMQVGGRVTLGAWLDGSQNAGIGVRFYALEGDVTNFEAASVGGSPILGRPFFNVLLNQEDALLVSYPGFVNGNVNAKFTNSFLGTDAYTRVMMSRDRLRRVDLIMGYQFLRMDDDTRVFSRHEVIDPNSFVFGAQIDVFDRFRGTNEFHGGMIGLQGTMARGCWSLGGMAKIGIGNNHQRIIIEGSQTVAFPPGPGFTSPNGLLAQPSNIGEHVRDRICYIPELTATLAYHVRENVSLSVGYNFIWMSDVVLSGDSIDRRVNLSQVPGPVVGPNLPAFQFHTSQYWVQGINFGIHWDY